MNTEHILFYLHKEYNTEKEITDNLRNKDYIQYGYIKLRDLNKWLNNEVVSVKMGMTEEISVPKPQKNKSNKRKR